MYRCPLPRGGGGGGGGAGEAAAEDDSGSGCEVLSLFLACASAEGAVPGVLVLALSVGGEVGSLGGGGRASASLRRFQSSKLSNGSSRESGPVRLVFLESLAGRPTS